MAEQAEWAAYRAEFLALSPEARRRWLARLMLALTIHGRTYYEAGTEDLADPEGLRRLNELTHRIARYNLAVVESDEQRMPDEVFSALLFEALPRLGIGPTGFAMMVHPRS